jgi:hypothetical protein
MGFGMHHGRANINENIFISLIFHNFLMQIESPNMLHISILSLNSLLNLGVQEMVKCLMMSNDMVDVY